MHLIETRLDFAAFVRACELQEGCKGLNLRAYLIMPVQRIPRYKLLLTELLKHTPEDHPDYQDLVAAVKLVSGVVASINEDISRQEKRLAVMEAQDRFGTPLITASRKYEKEGPLVKMCRKGPKKFIFVLFNDLLIYGAQQLASSDKCTLHRKMDLGEVFVVDSGEEEKTFVLVTRGKSFVVQCKDLAEKKEWMGAFAACFAEMEKTVVYGKTRVVNKDERVTNVSLWMVREGDMVREHYLMPELPEHRTYGFLAFKDLRLVMDPQGPDRGSVSKRVINKILRRGASLSSFNFKVQSENPVPCQEVSHDDAGNGEEADDDESTFADALSPRSSASASPLNMDLGGGDTRFVTCTTAGSGGGHTRRASPDLGGSGGVNDVGFQTASGFVDGSRLSGKWGGLLSGLRRPKGASSTSPRSVVDPDPREQHEVAVLENSLALMGLKKDKKAGAGSESSKPQQHLSPPPLLDMGAPRAQDHGKTGSTPASSGGVRPTKPTSPRRAISPPTSPPKSEPPEPHLAGADGVPPSASFASASSSFNSYTSGASTGSHDCGESRRGLSINTAESSSPERKTGASGDSHSPSHRLSTGTRPVKAPRSPLHASSTPPTPSVTAAELLNADGLTAAEFVLPPPMLGGDASSTSSTTSSYHAPNAEYVVVLPISDLGLGIFLRDESAEVVVGGFRSPKHVSGGGAGGNAGAAAGVNPSMRAGIKLGDVLLKVNGVPVTSVAHTISVLRGSGGGMEKVIALTLRRGTGDARGGRSGSLAMGGNMRVLSYSPPKPQGKTTPAHHRGSGAK